MFYTNEFFTRLRFGFFHRKVNVTTDHHSGQFFFRRVFNVDRSDIFTFAQNGASVRNRHNLVKFMRNEKNRLPFFGKIAHYLHKFVDFLRSKNRRRLVEYENFVVAVKHFQNFRSLLHTDRYVFDFCVGIDVQSVLFAQIHNFLLRFFLQDKTEFCIFRSENNVFQNGKTIYEFEVLMNHSYAEIGCVVRIVDLYFHPVFLYYAFVRLIKSEQNRHKGGFSCAVLSQKRVNFAPFKLQRDIVVCFNSGEYLGNVTHFDNVIRLLLGINALFDVLFRHTFLLYVLIKILSFCEYRENAVSAIFAKRKDVKPFLFFDCAVIISRIRW